MVLMRCRQLLGDDAGAEDAAQEVFVKVFEKRGALNVEYPSHLLWTMATNRCLDILRSRARRSEVAGGDSLLERIACSTDIEAASGARSVLEKLFGRYPEISRTIAVLHFVDGMTLEETARVMNTSVSTVCRTLQALRKTLAKLENDKEAI
jgi:RNA polymerase sigma-70 factor (ECF subfamily)